MAEDVKNERCLQFDDADLARDLFGPGNENLTMLMAKSGVDIQSRGSTLTLSHPDEEKVRLVSGLFTQMYGLLKAGHPVHGRDMSYGLRILGKDPGADLGSVFQDAVFLTSSKKTIAPKTLGQKTYVQAMREMDLVFGIGPAGTGKTYLAVAMAVSQLLKKRVKRLILTRPAVEAGEKLGFLPGDMVEKVNPYLRPLYDALHDMLEFARVREMIDTGVIEIAPLAYMRGRTLNDAFIILDEAQNTTPEQMKMFLTRLGFGSRAVVTGDVTQIDLPRNGRESGPESRSGLVQAQRVLGDEPGLGFVLFNEEDVIRHPLVGRIVHAYDRYSQSEKEDS